MTLDDAISLSKEKMDINVVADSMTRTLLLKKIAVTGNVMTDEYGPQITARSVKMVSTDVKAEAQKLYETVEGSL